MYELDFFFDLWPCVAGDVVSDESVDDEVEMVDLCEDLFEDL